MGRHEPSGEPLTARRGFFWVGIRPEATGHGTLPAGQMYVEWLAPAEVRRPHPVVLVHGGGGQGLDWLGTPDGRPGWATFLVQEGFAVYVVDRPGHGRSPYAPELLGPLTPPAPYEAIAEIFTPAPDSELGSGHTQWPAGGAPGERAIDQFMAGSGPLRADFPAAQALERDCLAELLDRVGPAIVFSHSLGGPAGFLAADARPELVAALVAIEPMGPPFLVHEPMGLSLAWGVAAAPLAYEPAVDDPALLRDGTPRRLANLARVPIAVVSAPHSLIAQGDPATVEHLRSHGCDVDALALADHGVTGNGHGMMLERNHREVLGVLLRWLGDRGVT
jgi:pimeloyl-ACP methyl ester carboxylesterase